MIDTKKKIHRIQIKTCLKPDGKRYGFSLKHSNNDKIYTANLIDFFALVCLELDVIYIVPIRKLKGLTTVKTWPTVEGSAGKLEKFREGWEELK